MLNFLSFSDPAKFADVARNLVLGLGYGSSFSFWSTSLFGLLKESIFDSSGILPVMPFSMAAFFKIFGIIDFAVIATSFFYFILTLVFVFLLARKIFKSNLVGALSTLAIGFNYDLIHYATSGASESVFIFEIVVASYFASVKKRWAAIVTLIFLVLLYFTRPQSFIYIAGIILFWLLNNFKIKKAFLVFIAVLFGGILIDRLVLLPLVGNTFFYSITNTGRSSVLSQVASVSASDALRGSARATSVGIVEIAKSIFYNLYNFYKLLPQIINPYLFALFVIGLFIKAKDKLEGSFKFATLFMFIVTFLVAAASIPFFRYLHPIIPLVYIMAIGTLVEILDLGFKNYDLRIPKRLFISKAWPDKALVNLTSVFLILLFGVAQTLGVLFLDSRFERNTHNVGRPPVYAVLAYKLKEITKPSDVIITNLDTWGSWYGERKTVWFPLEPKQLIDPATGAIPFDAIYLTSYLIDDENYYMGSNWRFIFENPTDTKKWVCDGCDEIAKEFELRGVYKVPANDNYERQDASAILLIKK